MNTRLFFAIGHVRLKSLLGLASLVLAAAVAPLTLADEAATVFVPATFKAGEQSLESRMFLPNSKKDKELTIFCNAIVSVRGIIENQLCNWDLDNKPYRTPTNNAISTLRMNPASVNGEKVIAYVKYAMKIQHKDGGATVTVLPHHMVNKPFYGDDYIAPQSYVAGTDLYATDSRFFGKPWIGREVPRKCNRYSRVFLKMKILKDGQATEIEVIDEPKPKSCGKSIASAAENGMYIPAFYKDEPVDAFYVEKYLAK